MGNNDDRIDQINTYLDDIFSIKYLGLLNYFISVEATWTPDGMVLIQRKYALDIPVDCGLQGCHPSLFPMEQNIRLDDVHETPFADVSQFRRLIGCLL